jgi:hypothetical protein
MTSRFKKTLLWYGIFITALTLNQSKAFTEDFIVKIVVHVETFNDIEDAINMILKYGYVLAEFDDCTGE